MEAIEAAMLTLHGPDDPRYAQPIRPDSIMLPASDCWIEPDGMVHPVSYAGHCQAAMRYLGDETGGRLLEDAGWAHVSGGRVMVDRATSAQIDALWRLVIRYRDAAVHGAMAVDRAIRYAASLEAAIRDLEENGGSVY